MRRWHRSLGLMAAATVIGCGNGTNNNGGSVQFTASGEVLALGGYAFPPATAGDPDFVDGWEVRFTKFIAVFDKVRFHPLSIRVLRLRPCLSSKTSRAGVARTPASVRPRVAPRGLS